ncbi:glycosyltransferase [Lysobacter olei]
MTEAIVWSELNWKGRIRFYLESALQSAAKRLLQPVLRGLLGGDAPTAQLNWRGLAAEVLKAVASKWMFPDHRAEWIPYARKELKRIADEFPPDIVVLSHEPACSLPLASTATALGLPWVADLGDPVFAPYTPERWRQRATQLERDICLGAGFISVTSRGAIDVLADRHGVPREKFLLLTQGYDATFQIEDADLAITYEASRLELLYTGSFYSFRRAESLLQAVCNTRDVRLTVATVAAPDYLRAAAMRYPESIRIAGFLPHTSALAAQRGCDVLVNIANADPVQVPGKIYEYLGAGRPIVHLRGVAPDATSMLVKELGVGWELGVDVAELKGLFEKLSRAKLSANGQIQAPMARHVGIESFAWRKIAADWQLAARALLQARTPSTTETHADFDIAGREVGDSM